ncbi:MAG: maleylpyruvate isomerase N-terminal domain-containing protein, partial [Sciscionella sp.]
YRAVLAWLSTGERPAEWSRQPAAEESTVEFLLGGLRSLVEELSAHPPEASAPTWWQEDETYGFWRRRMAHETTMHRVDVQDAVGVELTTVDADIALDGVDEALTLWFGRRLEMLGLSGNREAAVAVRSGGREWLAHASRDATSAQLVAPGVLTAADASVSAEPMMMYLWLWGRRPTREEVVVIDGDDDSVAQMWALLRLATR